MKEQNAIHTKEPLRSHSQGTSSFPPPSRDSRLEVFDILLIRHAETIDNVRHNYAGTTDSPLTNHGVLQAEALAASIANSHVITHIAASPLQRTNQTATAIQKATRNAELRALRVTLCEELIERDFGSLEGKSYLDIQPPPKRPKVAPPFFPKGASSSASSSVTSSKLPSASGASESKYEGTGSESHESLATRANTFIDSYLIPIIDGSHPNPLRSSTHSYQPVKTIAIVSHGILLANLFRELVARFRTITVSPEAFEAGFTMGKTPRWDNTGYTHLRLHSPSVAAKYQTASQSPQPLQQSNSTPSEKKKVDHHLLVKEINVTRHLKGIKRTGGGIGSARADPKQRSMKEFFKSKTATRVAGVKHERSDDPSSELPLSPSSSTTIEGSPPPPSSLNVPSSSFRTDASSDYFPSSPPQRALEEEHGGGVPLYQVADFF